MKNKTKIIVTSLASALVFGSIAVGGTYSLFSANADTNIAVTAGNIELSAVVGDLNLYSPALINLDGSIEDDTNIATATTFGNGGTASVRGNELTLSNIVPGDKVSTEIDIQNLSSIKTKYRFTIHASEGIELYSQLNIKINNEEILKLPYATSIDELDVGESPADKVSIEIQLPTTVGNEYANLSTKIVLSVEGYQWNTNVENYNYSLGSASDFKLFKEYSATESFEGQTIKLTSNVDLGGETFDGLYAVNREGLNRTGVAEGGFKGTFDGGNYIISNLTMGNRAAKKDSVGFFNYVNGGKVKNIKFENVSINTNSDTVGTVAGAIANNAVIQNIVVDSGSITGVEAGGIVGRMFAEGQVIDCINKADITSTNGTGGAAGIVEKAYYSDVNKDMIISGCENYGKITSNGYVAGIVALSAADISNCSNSGEIAITGTYGCTGGIVGEQQNCGSITNCVNNGSFSTTVAHTADGLFESIGGIVGWVRYNGAAGDYAKKEFIEVNNNVNNADVLFGGCVGGIVGIAYNAILCDSNTNNGQIDGRTFVAGIIGNLTHANNNTYDLGGTADYTTQIVITNNTNTNTVASTSGATCINDIVYNNFNLAQITLTGNVSTVD